MEEKTHTETVTHSKWRGRVSVEAMKVQSNRPRLLGVLWECGVDTKALSAWDLPVGRGQGIMGMGGLGEKHLEGMRGTLFSSSVFI